MKKLVLIVATTLMACSAWAQSQQLITVKGKTKDGKTINIQYYKGNVQDYIESVKYQLVDELKAENKQKQNTINDMQHQLNNANKQIANLNKQLGGSSGDKDQVNELNNQLTQKQSQIDQLNQQLAELNAELNRLQSENQRQKDTINYLKMQLNQQKSRTASIPSFGVEVGLGSVLMMGHAIESPWEKRMTWNKQVAVYYNTGSLVNDFPIALEFGLGFRNLPMKAYVVHHEVSGDAQLDCDGQSYQPVFVFDNFTEKLTLNSVEVPLRLCFGQPQKNAVSMYAKVGVTPSLIVSSNLVNGKYTRKGFYSTLNNTVCNVTFEDIEELDYFNNSGDGSLSVTPSQKFNVWGNVAFGAYFPMSSSLLFNVGLQVECPILKTGVFEYNQDNNTSVQLLPDAYRSGLNTYNGRFLIPSLQAGLVYTLK